MIRLPYNVDQVRGENITLRFASAEECGFKMLFEAVSAYFARDPMALDIEEQWAQGPADGDEYDNDGFGAPRPVERIRAEKDRKIAELNGKRVVNETGAAITLTVGEAISMVTPIEQIIRMSKMGVPVTAHNFTPAQVAEAASDVLNRFEQNIQAVAEKALQNVNVQENANVAGQEAALENMNGQVFGGMFMGGPEGLNP